MIGTGDIHTEAGPHIVNNQDRVFLCAELSHLLPEALGGHLIISEISVHVGLGNHCRDLILIFLKNPLQGFIIVPLHINIIADVFLQDSRIVYLLGPGSDPVVIAFKEDDFLFMGIGSGRHNGQRRHIVSVLGKESPVRRMYGIHQQLREINHFCRRRGHAVPQLHLGPGCRVHVRIAVTQHVGAVSAHIVNKTVAVHVPEITSPCPLSKHRVCLHRNKAALRRAQMSVYAGRNDLHRPGKLFSALCIGIDLSHHPFLLYAR